MSDIIKDAENSKHQTLLGCGEEITVATSSAERQEKTGNRLSLIDFLHACPVGSDELDLTRQIDYPRDIDFVE
jgi:hypothetical protein